MIPGWLSSAIHLLAYKRNCARRHPSRGFFVLERLAGTVLPALRY
jgi:hypothetical protein